MKFIFLLSIYTCCNLLNAQSNFEQQDSFFIEFNQLQVLKETNNQSEVLININNQLIAVKKIMHYADENVTTLAFSVANNSAAIFHIEITSNSILAIYTNELQGKYFCHKKSKLGDKIYFNTKQKNEIINE